MVLVDVTEVTLLHLLSGNFSGKFTMIDQTVVIGIDSVKSLVDIWVVGKRGVRFFTVDKSVTVRIDFLKNRRTFTMFLAVMVAMLILTMVLVVATMFVVTTVLILA